MGRPCYNLTGGLIEWKNQEQPVYGDGKPTEDVHPYLPALERYLQSLVERDYPPR